METLLPPPETATDGVAFDTLGQRWWADFLHQTDQFSTKTVFRDALTPAQVEQMNHYTMQAIGRLCERASSHSGFRVYLGGREQDEATRQAVFAQPPHPTETVTDWATRVFRQQKFGLIINQIEKFSGTLAEAISMLIQPLLTEVGIPLNGFHTSTFIGNYGYTPLGIHQDHRGSAVIHLHLGPGPKTMYTWNETLYTTLAAGKANNKNIEPLLPHATAHHFGTGDLYFMPWNDYHVGVSDELSVGVTFWFDNHTNDVILEKLFTLLKSKYLNVREKKITTPQRSADGFNRFGEVMAALNTDLLPPNASLRDVLQTIHQESLLTLFSNGGWRFKPLPLRLEGQSIAPADLLTGQLQAIFPYRLYYRLGGTDDLLIYCRGTELQVPNHPGLVRVLNRLNSGQPIATPALLNDLPDWPTDTSLYLLHLLVESRGVRFIPS
jgi:hypothetical protein